jgi:glycosyl transferase, family 25
MPGVEPTKLLTWVINLDRAPERLARIREQMQRLGLPFERLPAVDARAFTPEQQALLDKPSYRRKHGMEPLGGELGCYLSHLEVMRRFVASQADFALVLEDDVLLTERLPAALSGLMAHPQRWDMVKLSAVHSGTPQPVLQVAPGQQLCVMLSRCTGSSAYLMNRRAAQAYLEGLLPMQLPYDHVFDQGWRFGLKVRLLSPTPCVHDEEVSSTIATPVGQTSRKFHWPRRLPAHLYRLGNEWRRLMYGLSHTWRERRGA